jgi:hypothetical protein
MSEQFPFFYELVNMIDIGFWVEVILQPKTDLYLDFQYFCLRYLSSYLGKASAIDFGGKHESSQGPLLEVFRVYFWHIWQEDVKIVASQSKHFSCIVSFGHLLLQPFHHLLSQKSFT